MAKKKSENDYEVLADQIGSEGGASLGKLKNLDRIIGNKESLSDAERESMNDFLSKTNVSQEPEERETQVFDILGGWTPIDRKRLGLRGLFYPKDWQFRVRPATVEAIKNWSAIDDSDLYTKNNLFNEVLKECVSIHTSEGAKSWGKISSWDRLWFMLVVREYTFVKGEVAIQFDENCPNCGNKINYKLEADQLHFELPETEDIDMNCWNQEDRCWYINPSDYGLEGGMLKLYIPTLEKDSMILNWAIRQNQAKKQVSQAFLRILPWIIAQASTLEERSDKYIADAKKLYESWNAEMYEFVDNIIKNIQVTPKETLMKKCDNCGEEVHSEMSFPNGFRSMFSVQDRFKKFGKK